MVKKFFITTPIYYVNDKPHLGHAYTTIAADVLARYNRLVGKDVYFLAGTDEHGAKIAKAAKKLNLEPQVFVDEKAALYQAIWDDFNIEYNDFIRTTSKRHEKAVLKFFQKMKDNGVLYLSKYEGWYCEGCEAYKNPADLVEGKCLDHKTEPVKLSETNWFFKLASFANQLEYLISNNSILVSPESKKNEVLGLLKQGLQDIPVSRSRVEWGIKVPFDPDQTIYVWVDALINYLTVTGYAEPMAAAPTWPADVHLIGKDILKFHALIWPAMLLSVGLKLPHQIFAHGYFTVNGQKMSKTIGNVIDPMDLKNLYGADAARYLLLSEIPFGNDGDISKEKFASRYQSDLVNGLGNLASRVITLASKEPFEAKVSREFSDLVSQWWRNYHESLDQLDIYSSLQVVATASRSFDQLIDQKQPWKLKVGSPEFIEAISGLLEGLRHLAWMFYPFVPESSEKILRHLGMFDEEKILPAEKIQNWGRLKGMIKLEKIEPLFPRLQSGGPASRG